MLKPNRSIFSSISQAIRILLQKVLRETYGHSLTIHLFGVASIGLLFSCVLYFFAPLLEDDYHVYERFLPWFKLLDYSSYDSFVVDHFIVFLSISVPSIWLLLLNVAYSNIQSPLACALYALRVTSCLTVSFSLTVILTDFLSRRVAIAIIALSYGLLGLMYAWTVPIWRWYVNDARRKGLVTFLPKSLQHTLLRMTLFEWLTDTTFMDTIKPYLPFLLPLSRTEQNRLLEQMTHETQIMMQRQGLIGFLPSNIQKALLPATDLGECESEVNALELESKDKSFKLPRSASAGFRFYQTECVLDSASITTSSKDVFNDIISSRLIRTCGEIATLPSPKAVTRTAAISTFLFVLQLYVSKRTRQVVVNLLQCISATSLGSVACLAIFLRFMQLLNLSNQSATDPLLRYFQRYMIGNNKSIQAIRSKPEVRYVDKKPSHSITKAVTYTSAAVTVFYLLRIVRK